MSHAQNAGAATFKRYRHGHKISSLPARPVCLNIGDSAAYFIDELFG